MPFNLAHNFELLKSDFRSRLRDWLRPCRPELGGNADWHNRHDGETCFILGSGMSIGELDIKRLRGQHVITQNSFHLHPDFAALNPTYHVVIPPYLSERNAGAYVAWLKEIEAVLPAATVLWTGHTNVQCLESNSLFEGRRRYIGLGRYAECCEYAPIDLTRYVLHCPTSLTMCLTLAIALGYKRVFLIGFDLSQICTGKDQGRFYGSSILTTTDEEIELEANSLKTGEQFLWYWLIWKNCEAHRLTARKVGCEIFNLAPGGLLDNFPRRRCDDVLTELGL